MCEPLTLGALAIGAAGAGANAIGQARQAKAQKGMDAEWRTKQDQNRMLEEQRQEGLRLRARQEQEAGLKALGDKNQTKLQGDEAARLEQEFGSENGVPTVTTDVPSSDASLTSGDTGG